MKSEKTIEGHIFTFENPNTKNVICKITTEHNGYYIKGKNKGLEKILMFIDYGIINQNIITRTDKIDNWYDFKTDITERKYLYSKIGKTEYYQLRAVLFNTRQKIKTKNT